MNPNLSISSHMPIYEANFGWERLIFFRPVVTVDGITHILPSPSDDGSFYMVINLETQHIKNFKKLFCDISHL